MRSDVSKARSEVLHEQIVPTFVAMLDDASPLGDPAVLEQLAATLLVPLEEPEMPAEVAAAVFEAIEARRDPDAAGVLAALAALAAEPLAAQAAAGAQRLAGDGIASPAAAALGMLAVQEAVRIEGAGVELLVTLLRRPGAREVQPAMLAIEHEHTGGALVQCALAPPARFHDARELLDGVDGASAPEPVAPGELAARAVTAAHRAIDQEIALGHEAGSALPIVSRALTGDPGGLPRPAVLAPWEDDDPELIVDAADDEDGFQRVIEMLLAELEQYARATHPPGGAVWQHGDFVASTMLQYKGGYDDGRLGRWTQADLAEYLLDYFPRKVSVDDETLDAVPECVCAFLGFLDERGSLSGEPLEHLEHAVQALRDEFHPRARDNSQWGLAKSMIMQMQAEGVDPSAPGALDAWMADFNARPRAQRDAIIDSTADRMIQSAQPRPVVGPHAPQQQRAQRRKAQRTARKRNRRR
jgi:hypothetical protein